MPLFHPDAIAQAEQIHAYETGSKGFVGRAFGFEARDGFVSKAIKVLTTAAVGTTTAYFAIPLAMGFLGGAAGIGVSALAVATGALAGRMTAKSVIKDMHDAHSNGFMNIMHLGLTTASSAAVTAMALTTLLFAGPASFLALSAATMGTVAIGMTALPYAASKFWQDALGDSRHMEQSGQARELARNATSNHESVGQTVERLEGVQLKAKGPSHSNYVNSTTSADYALLQQRMGRQAEGTSFAQTIAQEADLNVQTQRS